MMLVSPSFVIARYLIARGVGVIATGAATRWQITNASMANTPDDFITIFDVPGVTDGKNFRTGKDIYHPLVQTRVRSLKYEEGYQKILEAEHELGRANKVTVEVPYQTTTVNVILWATTLTIPPSYLSQEEVNRRQHCVMTHKVTISEV